MRLRSLVAGLMLAVSVCAEDGYRLWLRYETVEAGALRESYAAATARIVIAAGTGEITPTLAAARDELAVAVPAMLGRSPQIEFEQAHDGPAAVGDEGFVLRRTAAGTTIGARRDVGALYGVFALLRRMQARQTLDDLNLTEAPRVRLRMLNHWDNLNGTVERGYAGRSIWDWDDLPETVSPRYRDYARTCASIGINAVSPLNVNAQARALAAEHLAKVAALASALRPYGIRLFLTARFSAPVELGRLRTADPLDPAVAAWWRDKVAEIYRLVPDFGGFLVKANSEGQPGPQDYKRTHADGANVIADALAPHGGRVIWRAFVYDQKVAEDRHKQAFAEFVPLDGQFRDNVIVQVKNGAIDFMPREPFHPLFGAMPRTPLALELQITQEYLGGSTQLAFLAPMWKETLAADTFRPAAGATVARVVERAQPSIMAGVANIGRDRNWCGNVLAPANWYAFGRLAWDHTLTANQIAEEWTRQTLGNDPRVVRTVTSMLLASHATVVDYSMPLGLHHIMARSHHQGPGPWVATGRADWTSTYYHRADARGIGFDRTAKGSGALGQYAPEIARRWGDLATCPEDLLLWFHHVPWNYRMRSRRELWEELCLRYQRGVDGVRRWRVAWAALAGAIDAERFGAVEALLRGQEREARIWRDACTQYFATFSSRALPAGVEPPEWELDYLRGLRAPFSAEAKSAATR